MTVREVSAAHPEPAVYLFAFTSEAAPTLYGHVLRGQTLDCLLARQNCRYQVLSDGSLVDTDFRVRLEPCPLTWRPQTGYR